VKPQQDRTADVDVVLDLRGAHETSPPPSHIRPVLTTTRSGSRPDAASPRRWPAVSSAR